MINRPSWNETADKPVAKDLKIDTNPPQREEIMTAIQSLRYENPPGPENLMQNYLELTENSQIQYLANS